MKALPRPKSLFRRIPNYLQPSMKNRRPNAMRRERSLLLIRQLLKTARLSQRQNLTRGIPRSSNSLSLQRSGPSFPHPFTRHQARSAYRRKEIIERTQPVPHHILRQPPMPSIGDKTTVDWESPLQAAGFTPINVRTQSSFGPGSTPPADQGEETITRCLEVNSPSQNDTAGPTMLKTADLDETHQSLHEDSETEMLRRFVTRVKAGKERQGCRRRPRRGRPSSEAALRVHKLSYLGIRFPHIEEGTGHRTNETHAIG